MSVGFPTEKTLLDSNFHSDNLAWEAVPVSYSLAFVVLETIGFSWVWFWVGVEGMPSCIYLGGLLLIVTLNGAQPGNCSIPFYHVIAPDRAKVPFFSGYSVEGSDDEYQLL